MARTQESLTGIAAMVKVLERYPRGTPVAMSRPERAVAYGAKIAYLCGVNEARKLKTRA